MVERRGDRDFLAVEVYQPGLGQLLLHAARRGVRNLRVCGDDVMDLLPRLGYEQFDEVFISFPDPWPKKRHHKRRLLQAPFFAQLRGKLQRHGRVFIATDSEDYAVTIGETIDGMPDWQNLAHRAMFAPRPRFRQITKFERRAMVADRKVYEFVLARKD
jgi:tRNA (guanine-N7-)-methyltransferase